MSLAPDFTALFNGNILVRPFSAYNSRGDATYSSATQKVYASLTQTANKMMRDAEGRDIVADHVVYVGKSSTGGLPNIALRDRVTTTGGLGNQPLKAVLTFRDETNATHHQELYY